MPGGVREIPLTKGYVALVDAADFDWLRGFSWQVHERPHTQYATGRVGGRMERMHRVILGAGSGVIVDHIDGNGLNNTRANLRFCTAAENARNMGCKNPAGLKGVRPRQDKWRAAIWLDGRQRSLGTFASVEEAARAYDAAAVSAYGDFARLNFPAAA